MALDPNKCMKFKYALFDFLDSVNSIEDLNSTKQEINSVLHRKRMNLSTDQRKKPFVNCFGIEIT